MTIGGRIRKARKDAGLTQAQLASKAGTATGTIQQYELGKRQPRIEQIKAIAEALRVPAMTLMDDFEIIDGKFVPGQEMLEKLDNVKSRIGNEIFGKLSGRLDDILDEIDTAGLYNNVEKLNRAFAALNQDGQKKAVERVEELTEIPKYQKNAPPPDGDGE